MITRELVPPRIGGTSRAMAATPTIDRFGRWFATKGWIHILLVTAVVGCLYPLFWMFAMSLKTDEELARSEIFPELPGFRDHSPYVRTSLPVTVPDDADRARFLAIEPALRDLSLSLVRAALPASIPATVDADEWAVSAASMLENRTLAMLPRQTWNEPSESTIARFRGLVTDDALASAVSAQLARVELSSLTLRTLDGRLFDLAHPKDGRRSEPYRVASGAASLSALSSLSSLSSRAGSEVAGDSFRLDYRFESGSDAPVIVTHDFELPDGVDAADIHKLIVGLRADESWHGLDATVDVGGVRWESARTTFLAQNRGQSISFQPPTYDDTTIRPRTWVSLVARGTTGAISSAGDRRGQIALRFAPSSRVQAITAKIERNYLRAFDSVPFVRYVANSVLLVVLTIAGTVFSSAFVAYAFARLAWPGRSVALVLLLATMMVPAQVTMIPSFLVWRSVGFYNTLNPMWIPAWLGNPFFVFLMIQHMKTIPRELEEAARIDGLGVVRTWWYIIVPLLKPTLAAIAVMTFLGTWNELMGPLIYLRDQAKFPLSLGLFGMRLDHGADWSMLMAANVLMTVPSLVVFFCFQRYLIEGVAVTGMKG